MSNEKENEMNDLSSNSDIHEFYDDPEYEEPVDVRQYVISLGQAGIHGPIVSRTQICVVFRLVRTNLD